ncbi:DUF3577 domain-containing protein [Neisseria canis]|uniref:Protein of uncharacterized function (DUF3577) n=1 Tax=Neisseria canis TaxID=493 RepID=A0A448D9K6_9NEIS|nr:DUF3577 domain-containing protein [Neisseria canis]VEF02393.1 Protein of uncharacterised function (DUF3577) [Neisseria canis]
MTNQTQNQNPAQNNYVDLVTTGIGYLNRPRWVTPDKGKPYLTCSINAWYGQDGKESLLFETNVFGQAREALNMLFQAYPQLLDSQAGPKVTVTCGFTIGDGVPDGFKNKKGEHVSCIRGRLFKLSWINVNKQRFFTLQTNEEQQPEAQVPHSQPQVQNNPPVQQQHYAPQQQEGYQNPQPQQPVTQTQHSQPQVQNNPPAQQQHYAPQQQEGYQNPQENYYQATQQHRPQHMHHQGQSHVHHG